MAMPSLMSPREVLSVPGDVLKRDLEKNLGGTSLGRWGHVWAQKRQAVVLVPWDDPVRFMENPLIFVDETYDERAHVFAYGAIVVRPSEAITSTLWYLEGLLKIRAAWQAFWPSEVAPPRLHLRELFPEAARAKTRWAHLPGGDLTYVVREVLGVVRTLQVKPFIMPVPEDAMNRALELAYSEGFDQAALPDARIQAVALQFRAALAHGLNLAPTYDLVVDHDKRDVKVGSTKRQTTLRFRDLLRAPASEEPFKNLRLRWDPAERCSSQFPAGFSHAKFSQAGYPLRPLVDAIQLQFIDMYLGLWRQLHFHGRSQLGITGRDLGQHRVQEIRWADGSNSTRSAPVT